MIFVRDQIYIESRNKKTENIYTMYNGPIHFFIANFFIKIFRRYIISVYGNKIYL